MAGRRGAEQRGRRCAIAMALALAGGCRDLDPWFVSDAGTDGCVPAADGGCEAPVCDAPDGSVSVLRECDELARTVCETDVSVHAHHCGACNSPCDELCSQGQCKAIDRLLPGVSFAARRRSVAVSGGYVYALAPTEKQVNIHRVPRAAGTGNVEVFLESAEDISELSAGADRVYLRIGERVWSKSKFGTAGLEVEAAAVADFAAEGPLLVWLDFTGAVYQRNVLADAPLIKLGTLKDAKLVTLRESRVVVVTEPRDDALPRYTLFAQKHDVLKKVGDGQGVARRLEMIGAEAFVLSALGEERVVTRFFLDAAMPPIRYTAPSGSTVDFAVDASHLFLSWTTSSQGGFDVVALDDSGLAASSGLPLPPRQLELDGSDLYFIEDDPPGLSHLRTDELMRP